MQLDETQILELAGGKTPEETRAAWERAGERCESRVRYLGPPRAETEQTLAKLKAANDRIRTQRPKTAPQGRSFKPEMNWEEARAEVRRLFTERGDQIASNKNLPEFRWDFGDGLGDNVANMIRYFINHNGPLALNRGLLIYGSPGSTKTETMMIFERFARSAGLSKTFAWSNLSTIYSTVGSDDFPLEANFQFDRCFDELATMTGAVPVYGRPVNPTEEIIARRYERFQKYGQITHFITNHHPNDLEGMLDQRAYSRLCEMCQSVHFKGGDKRRK